MFLVCKENVFSSGFAITERKDIVMTWPCLCLFLCVYVSQLPYVRYYVVVKSSCKHTRDDCESKRAYVF